MKVRVVLTVEVDPDIWRDCMEPDDGVVIRDDIRHWVSTHVSGSLSHLCPAATVRDGR